jgi:hypothetical protein
MKRLSTHKVLNYRNAWRILSLLLFILSLTSLKSIAQPITIDGNPIDWTNFTTLYPNGHAITHDVANASNSTDDQFTNGAQDPDALSTWGWSLGNANNKGDITNAGAIIYTFNNINYIAFSGDRTAINGDAAIGFWFFKSPVSLGSNGTFSGTHTNGDLLVLSHFTNGGGMSQILLYQWNNGLQYVGTYNDAAVNSGPYPVPSPFSYTTSGGASGTYPTGAFFEGVINLTAIHASPCFANFMIETRNSQSINASLQDFAFSTFTSSVPAPSTTGDIRCGAGTVNLSASGCDGGTLNWYDAATGGSLLTTGASYSPTITATTTYYVSCTTGEGCTSDRAAVTGTIHGTPSVTATADPTTINLFAANHSSQLNATASPAPNSLYNFSWTQDPAVGGSLSATNIANPVFTATAAGTYMFIVTAVEKAAPYCSAKDTVYVDVLASAPRCDLSGPQPVCSGSTGLVYSGGTIPANFTFHWTVSGGATITSAPSDSSSITVTAGSSNFTVTLWMTPDNTDLSPISCPLSVTVYSVSLGLNKTDVLCSTPNSGTVTATFSGGVAPYSISIDAGSAVSNATSPYTFTGLAAGSHSITVTDANGCSNNGSISLGGATGCTEGCTIGFWKNHTYLWNSTADPIAQGAGFITGSNFYSYFGITSHCNLPSSLTMIEALNLGGGGCYNLARQAVGAALNIGAGLNYGYAGGLAQLKLDVAAAFNGGCDCSALGALLDGLNNNDQVCGRLVHPITVNPGNIQIEALPEGLDVKAFPNPYTDKVTFTIKSPVSGQATLEVYNMIGQRVSVLYSGYLKAGMGQTIDYNVPENDRGNLIYILKMKDHRATGKLIRPN